MRINKYIAQAGVASRRAAERLIKEKKVKVNGVIIDDLATIVGENDKVTVEGRVIKPIKKKYYIALNKPVGYICSNDDRFNDETIFDLIDIQDKLFSIGRLDKDSEGLIIVTNDGDLYNQVIHPKSKIMKYYKVRINKQIYNNEVQKMRDGIIVDGYKTKPCEIEILANAKHGALLNFKISEGKNRQIRKMIESIGYEVVSLQRYQVGKIKLGELKLGKYRHLNPVEIESMRLK